MVVFFFQGLCCHAPSIMKPCCRHRFRAVWRRVSCCFYYRFALRCVWCVYAHDWVRCLTTGAIVSLRKGIDRVHAIAQRYFLIGACDRNVYACRSCPLPSTPPPRRFRLHAYAGLAEVKLVTRVLSKTVCRNVGGYGGGYFALKSSDVMSKHPVSNVG